MTYTSKDELATEDPFVVVLISMVDSNQPSESDCETPKCLSCGFNSSNSFCTKFNLKS